MLEAVVVQERFLAEPVVLVDRREDCLAGNLLESHS